MATISVLKNAVRLCRAAGITPFIWGHLGLGKSSLCKQLTLSSGFPVMGFIDMRCSQLENSDIRGLPVHGDDGRTHYLPPADMPVGDMTDKEVMAALGKELGYDVTEFGGPEEMYVKILKDAENDFKAKVAYNIAWSKYRGRYQYGILLLDELNRASDDVLQAAFQLVLDKRIGEYVLPPGWMIVAAGNYGGSDAYTVSGFRDAAFLSRFTHLTLESGSEKSLGEWVDYISDVHGEEASEVIEFVTQNADHLDGKMSGDLGFKITPCRRSWDMVISVEKAYKAQNGEYGEDALRDVIAGLVSREMQIAWFNYSCPVKPRDVLKNGVRAMNKQLKDLNRNQFTGLMWGLISYAKDRVGTDEHVGEVCLDFAEMMLKEHHEKDVVVAFCRALLGTSKLSTSEQSAMLSNPHLAKMLAKYRQEKDQKEGKVSTRDFIDRLNSRPSLQELLTGATWGLDTVKK